MIGASHLIVGGAAGKLSGRAWIALPIAFASHYVMDLVPHSCFNMLPGAGAYWGPVFGVLGVSTLVAVTFRQRERWVIWAAGLIACLPDALDHMRPIADWFHLLPGSYCLTWVHRNIHCDVTLTHCASGFVTQAIVVGIGLWILTRKRKASR